MVFKLLSRKLIFFSIILANSLVKSEAPTEEINISSLLNEISSNQILEAKEFFLLNNSLSFQNILLTNLKQSRSQQTAASYFHTISGLKGNGRRSFVLSTAEKCNAKVFTIDFQNLTVFNFGTVSMFFRFIFTYLQNLGSSQQNPIFLVAKNINAIMPNINNSGIEYITNELMLCLTQTLDKNIAGDSEIHVFMVVDDLSLIHNSVSSLGFADSILNMQDPSRNDIESFIKTFIAKKYPLFLSEEEYQSPALQEFLNYLFGKKFSQIINIFNMLLCISKNENSETITIDHLTDWDKNQSPSPSFGNNYAADGSNLNFPELLNDLPFPVKVFYPGEINMELSQVVLAPNVLETVNEVVDFIKSPEIFKRTKSKMPNGVLIYGPPGVGKTFLAKAIAAVSGSVFIHVDSSMIISKYIGDGARNISKVFSFAKDLATKNNCRAIIFMDEIDSIGANRDSGYGSYQEDRIQIINQILNELDGFCSKQENNVVLFGATNRKEVLDDALTRPGRLEIKIALDLPNKQGRALMLKELAKSYPFSAEINLDELAENTINFSGADIASLVNRAAIVAARDGCDELFYKHFCLAFKNFPQGELRVNLSHDPSGRGTPFNVKLFYPGFLKVKLAEVVLPESVTNQVMEIIDFIKNPESFKKTNSKFPHGILFYGPPGVGKTYLAQAIASESDSFFIQVDSSMITGKFIGESARNIKAVFDLARELADRHNCRVLIFIDEIDSVASHRTTGAAGYSDNNVQIVNQILNELDGFSSKDDHRVILLGATNRVDSLDEALVRPGRFEFKVALGLPSLDARLQILHNLAKVYPLSDKVDLKELALLMGHSSGADIKSLINNSAILAAREGLDVISDKHVKQAYNKFLLGYEDPSLVTDPKENWLTAVHETGHAVQAIVNDSARNLRMISCVPSGKALGVTISTWDQDMHSFSKENFLAELQLLMGGYTAEKFFLKVITSGASNDLERAKKLAVSMISRYAMTEDFGAISLKPNLADDDAGVVQDQAKELLTQAAEACYKVYRENFFEFLYLASKLYKEKHLSREAALTYWSQAKKSSAFLKNIKHKLVSKPKLKNNLTRWEKTKQGFNKIRQQFI